ncbi:MAG: glycosyl transferase [Patescibacteria group bacterium]|nr:MAG: glycosyl transferase [Patescibacteria group bacterium]
MLSVVLATYNEEKNIEKCLRSIKEIAGEIIVVDGSSTDKTPDLAKKLGAKVIITSNKPNFHINKQMAMDEAKGELVLQLDADEWPDDELKEFIKRTHKIIMKEGYRGPLAWWLKRKNYFLGQYFQKGGQYPDPVIRLYVNGYAKLPQKDVHEQMQVKGEIGWAEGHLIHFANPTFADYLRKFGTYTSFKAHQLEKDGIQINPVTTLEYIGIKPLKTFLQIFIRHKGFVDGVPGFVFAVMSGLHHAVAYLQLWELKEKKKLAKEGNYASR